MKTTLIPNLASGVSLVLCLAVSSPTQGADRPAPTLPPLKPFGELVWGDGIPSTLEKLSHIGSLEHLSVYLADRELKVTPPKNSAEVAELMRGVPPIFTLDESGSTGRSTWVEIPWGGGEILRFATVPAQVVAGPVLIEGIPFTIQCEFRSHAAIILRNAAQVFKDPKNGVTFAYALSTVTVKSASKQLPDHFRSINGFLVEKYGSYYYPLGVDYPGEGGKRNLEADLGRTGFARVGPGDNEITIRAQANFYAISYSNSAQWKGLDETLRKYLATMEKDASKSAADMKKDL
jgi:hypothetical protein